MTASNPSWSRKPFTRPSNVDAKREIVAAATNPPGRTTRRASASAATRSARSCRWYSGPSSRAASKRVLERQPARVADHGVREPLVRGLLDVERDRIDQVHLVAPLRQRDRVDARSTADVHNRRS